jgi:hypothetical protein
MEVRVGKIKDKSDITRCWRAMDEDESHPNRRDAFALRKTSKQTRRFRGAQDIQTDETLSRCARHPNRRDAFALHCAAAGFFF